MPRKNLSSIIFLILLFFYSNANSSEWQCINRSLGCNTWRLEVPLGWVVASDNNGTDGDYAMVYVPDKKHDWKIKGK